ncbi:hypothetical protein EcE24377A_1245 [Escherichia coli O139:H28 str. E24377A]|uniref:Uncharacterized protein n=1 Tax=Escherichia coli O139:H28 (strain E24377A / ETEC) TaxID=331111 RepID=A7ZKM6_ECO24|nr:hypothetical protein EcE24377A_1245 [Escherichia coli O139:H28 str. E24377A]EID65779.1 hypothetical protein ECW26_37140 [Escherichia coli W26]EIE56776.1 hypothetical protein ECAI27_10890 [Escherichia coli AI27]
MIVVPNGINNDSFCMNRAFGKSKMVIKDDCRNNEQYQTDTEKSAG